MRPIFVALIIAVVVVASGASVAATPPGDEPGQPELLFAQAGDRSRPAPDLRQRLNLTEEQNRQVQQIMANHRLRAMRLRIALDRARLDAREVMLEATPDRARLTEIARRVGEAHGQLAQARFEFMLELRRVLTADQWARLMALEGRPGRFRGRFR